MALTGVDAQNNKMLKTTKKRLRLVPSDNNCDKSALLTKWVNRARLLKSFSFAGRLFYVSYTLRKVSK